MTALRNVMLYTVKPWCDGWAVHLEGRRRVHSLHSTQAGAHATARTLARRTGGRIETRDELGALLRSQVIARA